MNRRNLQNKYDFIQTEAQKNSSLLEGIDYYYENGLMVLTAHFLKKRGYCCGNDCRHCPYEKSKKSAQSK